MHNRIKELTDAARRLAPSERAALVEAIWDSLAAEPDEVDMPDWHKAELDLRLAKQGEGAEPGRSWEEIKHDLSHRTKE